MQSYWLKKWPSYWLSWIKYWNWIRPNTKSLKIKLFFIRFEQWIIYLTNNPTNGFSMFFFQFSCHCNLENSIESAQLKVKKKKNPFILRFLITPPPLLSVILPLPLQLHSPTPQKTFLQNSLKFSGGRVVCSFQGRKRGSNLFLLIVFHDLRGWKKVSSTTS